MEGRNTGFPMRIGSSQVSTSVAHEAWAFQTREESLLYERGPAPDAMDLSDEAEDALEGARPSVLGPTVQETLDGLAVAASHLVDAIHGVDGVQGSGDPMVDLKMAIIIAMIERMTGRRVQLMDPRDLQPRGTGIDLPASVDSVQAAAAVDPGYSLEYHRRDHQEDGEFLKVQTKASVETGDGRRLEIDVEVQFDRRWVKDERIDVLGGRAALKKDPLVLQYGGSALSLSDQTFRFDLDADGTEEEIHQLGAGGGFLAIDRDGSGVIEDGGELFGPASGDGFADLRAEDDDGNGWIDEGDAVFSQLRVSTRGEGGDQLLGLIDLGVGALHLGAVRTPYSMRDKTNQEIASIRESAVWIGEDEGAGFVHEIDLVV